MHVRGEWLVDIAPHYFDLANFPQGECRRVLERCARRRIFASLLLSRITLCVLEIVSVQNV